MEQQSGVLAALVAALKVLAVLQLAVTALFIGIFLRRVTVRQPARTQPATSDAPVPAAEPDTDAETLIETLNGGVYTKSEYQALQARYTAEQWATFEALAAQYAALHVLGAVEGE